MEIVKDRNMCVVDFELGSCILEECLCLGLSMNIVRVKGYGGVFCIVLLLMIIYEELDLGVVILDQVIQYCMVQLKRKQDVS